jgi:hypothetical protein
MFKNTTLTLGLMLVPFATIAAEVPITGTVESRCIIQTDKAGAFGNPNAYTLTTTPADGGDSAIVRFDVTLADSYYAEITPPTAFSSSPSLPDQVTWTGSVAVDTVSDATGMGTYESSKVEVGDTDRYDMTATGSTWFKIDSTATMGGNKAFAGGTYTAVAEAVCIAK